MLAALSATLRPSNRQFRSIFVLILTAFCLNHSILAQDDEESETEAPSNQARSQFPLSQAYFDWVSEKVEKHQVLWLEGEEKFFSLNAGNRYHTSLGAAILLPGSGQHAGMANMIRDIHRYLPDFGWQCVTLSLPERRQKPNAADSVHARKNSADPAQAAQAGEDSEAELDEEPPTEGDKPGMESMPISEVISKRLTAAAEHILKQGQNDIVYIGFGDSGIDVAEYVGKLDDPTKQAKALVLINLRPSPEQDIQTLISLLRGLKVPILDVYNSQDIDSEKRAQQRKRQIIGANPNYYRQLALPRLAPHRDDQNNIIGKRVRGWLASL